MKKYLLVCLALMVSSCTYHSVQCQYYYDVIPASEHAPFPVMEDYAMRCETGEHHATTHK